MHKRHPKESRLFRLLVCPKQYPEDDSGDLDNSQPVIAMRVLASKSSLDGSRVIREDGEWPTVVWCGYLMTLMGDRAAELGEIDQRM